MADSSSSYYRTSYKIKSHRGDAKTWTRQKTSDSDLPYDRTISHFYKGKQDNDFLRKTSFPTVETPGANKVPSHAEGSTFRSNMGLPVNFGLASGSYRKRTMPEAHDPKAVLHTVMYGDKFYSTGGNSMFNFTSRHASSGEVDAQTNLLGTRSSFRVRAQSMATDAPTTDRKVLTENTKATIVEPSYRSEPCKKKDDKTITSLDIRNVSPTASQNQE